MNPHTHFYLYAKGWYKKSENITYDLKVLTSQYSAIPYEYISERDVFQVLMELSWSEISRTGNPSERFKWFMSKTNTDGWEKACLSLLNGSNVVGLEIGRPDSTLFEYDDGITDETIDSGEYNWNK